MGDLEREMLLGYLMNALEDDEIARVERELLRQPKLRTELATLQKELTSIYDSVDPPHHLTRRTCDKIWAHIDREERHGHLVDMVAAPEPIISMTIPSSCFENKKEVSSIPKHLVALEEIFAVSPQVAQPTSTDHLLTKHSGQKRLVRQTSCSNYSNNSNNPDHSNNCSNISDPDSAALVVNSINSLTSSLKSMKKSRMFDIIVSVAVGILIAVIAFPAINYVKNRTERHFAWNAIHQINKNVDQYTQIQRGSGDEFLAESQPSSSVNLAQSGWQELKPVQLPALIISDSNTTFHSAPIESYPNLLKTVSMNSTANAVKAVPSQGRDIILGQVSSNETALDDVPLDPREFTDQTLISNVDHVMPVIGGSTLQTAYGQNVLFQNGRIFIRILPVFAPGK